MMIVTRDDAIRRIIDDYGVDMTDWASRRALNATPAMIVVELQMQIMQAANDGEHAASRLHAIAPHEAWRDNDGPIMSYAIMISQCADRLRFLRPLLRLAIEPYLPREQ